MGGVCTVRLELLRTGEEYGKEVSRATEYLALCGDADPVTIKMPFDQKDLEDRLLELRYEEEGPHAERRRQNEIRKLGKDLGEFFTNLPALNLQLGASASAGPSRLVHLQLVVWGSELAVVPFELATAPRGFPGATLPLLMQLDVPVALTRAVRRARPPQIEWDRPPRVLFAWAAPPSVGNVPASQHLAALHRAVEPFVSCRPPAGTPGNERLAVLEYASLEGIRRACSTTAFTHVHILAHGVATKEAGESRYRIALHHDRRNTEAQYVSGQDLANALQPGSHHGRQPTVVTLMTCDGGNIGSTRIPGGSIAHDLHAFGIPWVIASQLPLTVAGSIILTEIWYSRILLGDDPRRVLHQLRRHLYSDPATMHDWASLVVYAVTPPDLDAQIRAYRCRQTKARVEVLFDNAERSSEAGSTAETVPDELIRARQILETWRAESVDGNGQAARAERAERLGLSAAAEKRIALLLLERAALSAAQTSSVKRDADDALAKSLAFYRQACAEEWTNIWVLTQFLSLTAIHAGAQAGERFKEWTVARALAERQVDDAEKSSKAWALATLAELELLGFAFGHYAEQDTAAVSDRVERYCGSISDIMGPDSFHVRSTRRQFERYATVWSGTRPEWRPIATAALRALPAIEGGPYSAAAG